MTPCPNCHGTGVVTIDGVQVPDPYCRPDAADAYSAAIPVPQLDALEVLARPPLELEEAS